MNATAKVLGQAALGGAVAAILIGLAALRLSACAPQPKPAAPPSAGAGIPPPVALSRDCHAAGWEPAAHINRSSLGALPWAPFGRDEVGWKPYALLIAREIGVDCPPGSTGFARALAGWQQRHGLAGDGLVSQVTFVHLKGELQGRRPILLLSAQGICAAPADERGLETLKPEETFGDKLAQLRPGAAAAYRRMVAAARADDARIAADPQLMTIFSGYRSPAYDAARCAAQENCNGRERAVCSPHRTGLAFDIYLGHAAGMAADSSADANRLVITEGPAYRWMVLNADRFGFVNYPFEPWHWEWTGEAPGRP